MSDLEHLSQIIDTVLSQNNEARKRSESLLQSLRDKDISQYIYAFTELLKLSPKSEIKVFCLIHIRRQLSDFVESQDGKWHVLHPDTQKHLKDVLLDKLKNDEDPHARKVLNDIIGELAATIQCMDSDRKNKCTAEGTEWPELMQSLWELLNTGNSLLMESALKIMGTLFIHCGQNYANYKDELVPIFRQALVHASPTVNVSAMETLSCYTENVEFRNCKAFLELMPLFLSQTLVVIEHNEDYGVDALGAIMDILDTEPKMFKDLHKDLVQLLKTILKSDVMDGLKQSALETLLISVERLPKIYTKDQVAIKEIAELVFTYMITSAEDPDEEWLSPPDGFIETIDDEDSPESTIHFCMGLIDRMIAALNKKQTLALLSELILEMVKVNNWRYQFCALMCLSQCGEHIDDLNEFDPIVTFVINFLGSDHPKVRYAALHVLGQTAEDCKIKFQARYGKIVLPSLIGMFNDRIPRVVYHSLNALTNFLDGCPQDMALQAVNEILEPCLLFLQNGSSVLKEGSMTTIGNLAEACSKEFGPYWQRTAEAIFQVLNTTAKELKPMRGQAIETLSLIAEAVGREEFKKVCHAVIEKMVEIQTTDIEKMDPQNSYLLSSWHRICSVLLEDFIPYLNFVMPSLFKLVEDIIKSEEDKKKEASNDDEENDVVRRAIKGKNNNNNKNDDDDDDTKIFHNTNTSESSEIAILARMMRGFAIELKSGYLPYVEKTSEILLHLLEKSDNEEVRTEAAQGLPHLVRVVMASNHPNKAEIGAKFNLLYLQTLWEQLWEEYDPETMGKLVEVMQDVVVAGGRCMSIDELNLFNENVLKTLKKSDDRKNENAQYYQTNADDFDDDDEEILGETNKLEEELHLSLAELIGTLFKVYKEATLPLVQLIYNEILPKALNPEMPLALNKFGLFLIDDMIEHLGVELIPEQWPHLSEALLKYASHSNLEVRHAAIYGIGQLGEKSKETFKNMSDVCMKALYNALEMQKKSDEDAEDFGSTKDNIVAALGKIIKSQYSNINLKEAIKVWLNHLPLKYDLAEGKVQHELLVDIILESDASLIFGDSGENLPRTMKVLAEVVNTKASSEGFKDKVAKVIQLLAGNEATKTLLQSAIGNLDAKHQKKLREVVEQ